MLAGEVCRGKVEYEDEKENENENEEAESVQEELDVPPP